MNIYSVLDHCVLGVGCYFDELGFHCIVVADLKRVLEEEVLIRERNLPSLVSCLDMRWFTKDATDFFASHSKSRWPDAHMRFDQELLHMFAVE